MSPNIPSPIGQTIDVVATTVSRSVISGGGGGRNFITGRGGGGGQETERGGALAVRPQTSLVDMRQDFQIQENSKSINALQQSLDVIRVSVTDLGRGVTNVDRQLQADGNLEKINLRNEQEQERKLNERRIRLGRENQLERNIAATLTRPIVKLQRSVTGIFDRVMNALTTLFFGWLANQGIETLKALAEGDSKKLEEIKNNVIKNILFAVGTFAAVNVGFGLLMRGIRGLAFKLAQMTARLLLSPFRAAGGAAAKLFGIGRGGGGKVPSAAGPRTPGRVPITTSGGKPVPRSGGVFNQILKPFQNIKGANFLKGGSKTISRFIPLANITVSGSLAAYDFSKGDVPGGLLNTLGMLPGPFGWVGSGGRILLEGTRMMSGNQPQSPAPPSPAAATPSPAAATPSPAAATPSPAAPASQQEQEMTPGPVQPVPVQPLVPPGPQPITTPQSTTQSSPQTPVIPPPSPEMVKQFEMAYANRDNPLARGRIESAWNNMTYEQQQQAKNWAKSTGKENEWNKMKLIEKPLTPVVTSSPANIQPTPKPSTSITTLPEIKPNVIIASSGQSQTQTIPLGGQTESFTDVPLISSSNIDNFYVLYSQVLYNVVS
jgi:hypothetical protein